MKLHPGYEKRPDDPLFMDSRKTPLTEAEATYYLKTAWKNVFNKNTSKKSLALLWAQSLGETYRWKSLRCYNFGNIKRRKNDTKLRWTSYEAGEYINGKHIIFQSYHPQTHFAAWDNPLDGAEYYIRFLSGRKRYKKAWAALMMGDPVAYCRELKAGGYFTAPLEHYTKGVVSLTNEFKRKAALLMAWEPPKPSPAPGPEPEPFPDPVIIVMPDEPDPEPEQSDPIQEPYKPKLGFFEMIMELFRKLFS